MGHQGLLYAKGRWVVRLEPTAPREYLLAEPCGEDRAIIIFALQDAVWRGTCPKCAREAVVRIPELDEAAIAQAETDAEGEVGVILSPSALARSARADIERQARRAMIELLHAEGEVTMDALFAAAENAGASERCREYLFKDLRRSLEIELSPNGGWRIRERRRRT